jgi:hypothetical protein
LARPVANSGVQLPSGARQLQLPPARAGVFMRATGRRASGYACEHILDRDAGTSDAGFAAAPAGI